MGEPCASQMKHQARERSYLLFSLPRDIVYSIFSSEHFFRSEFSKSCRSNCWCKPLWLQQCGWCDAMLHWNETWPLVLVIVTLARFLLALLNKHVDKALSSLLKSQRRAQMSHLCHNYMNSHYLNFLNCVLLSSVISLTSVKFSPFTLPHLTALRDRRVSSILQEKESKQGIKTPPHAEALAPESLGCHSGTRTACEAFQITCVHDIQKRWVTSREII